MKSKPKSLLLLGFFLCVYRTSHAASYITWSEVESLVVDRSGPAFDVFTVKMKPHHRCTNGSLPQWCKKLSASLRGSEHDATSCKCICGRTFYSFIPPMQRCIGKTVAETFGGCPEYLDEQNLLNYNYYLVDLTQTSTKTFSVTNVHSCSLSTNYFVHDYSGFINSTWETIKNQFFVFEMDQNKENFHIKWGQSNAPSNLLGRIIRLVVTCQGNSTSSSFTRCLLLKAKGIVTYHAPVLSSASSTYQAVWSSHIKPLLPSLSTTSSLVTESSSSPQSSPLSLSASLPLSSSLSLSSSTMPSRSLPPPPSPSMSPPLPPPSSPVHLLSSTSSALSPSPSLVLSSNAGSTSALPQLTSSSLLSKQSQTARLPAFTTGEIPSTSRAELQSMLPFNSDVNSDKIATAANPPVTTSAGAHPIKPLKTTSTVMVSSSSAAGGGSPGDKRTRTSENDNGVVIGAAVGGAVVLGIIVIGIIVFWKRRKAGENTEKQSKQVKNRVYGTSNEDIQLERPNGSQTIFPHGQDDQATYQGLIIANGQSNEKAVYSSPDDEYDNCTVYQSLEKPRSGTPVYQSLKTGQEEPAHTTGLPNLKPKPRYTTLPNATETQNPKRNGATGKTNLKGKTATGVPIPKPGAKGHPSQQSSVTAEPVYNVLDGPGSDQGSTPEPLYNILEGPDTGQDYEATNVDPLYNVLEGRNTTNDSAETVLESNGAQNGPISGQSPDGDPLYNVLEGPESDQKSLEHGRSTAQEPLYNVLEGPDAEKSPLVDQGGPINEPLYNVLEGPDSGGSNQRVPNKPHPLSGHDNLAYEQTLEMDVPSAAVQRPWTQRESVYEALRGPTQDVYEALGQSGDPHSTC